MPSPDVVWDLQAWFATPPLQQRKAKCPKKDIEGAISQMLDFFGIEVRPEVIRAAPANNTLDRMREKETQSKMLHQAQGGEEGRFVRKGSVGGWRERLTDEQLQMIDEFAGDVFRRMGFPLAAGVAARNPMLAN